MKGLSAAAIAAIGTKVVSTVSALLAATLITYSGMVLYDTVYTDRAAFISSDLSQYRPVLTEEEPTFDEMAEVNPDSCAWITMLGTHIDYPIVQGKDDVEYANKDIYGQSSLTGSIYLTVVNSREFTDSFNLIYGHHMDNGAMFGDIEKYEDMNYFRSHQDGILVTTRGAYDIHIIGRLSADAYDSKVYQAGDRPSSDFPDYLYYLKSLSVQWDESTDIEAITANIQKYISARNENIAQNGRFVFKKMPQDAVENGMQLIALSTCADAETNGRQLLVGTMKFRTKPLPEEMLIDDSATPLVPWGHGVAEHWALLNAICVIMMTAIFLPGRRIPRKYRRCRESIEAIKARGPRTSHNTHITNAKQARGLQAPEHTQHHTQRRIPARDRADDPPAPEHAQRLTGAALELLLTIFAIAWFIWTEDITKPMMIVDRWTLGMIALFAVTLAVDVLLVKYNEEPAARSIDV